jgi:hypothetical protein
VALSRNELGHLGKMLAWPYWEIHAQQGKKLIEELQIPDSSPTKRATLSLIDRFDSLLSIGRKIAAALTEEDIYACLETAVQSLLRVPDYAILAIDPLSGKLGKKFGNFNESIDEELVLRAFGLKTSLIGVPKGSAEGSLLCAPVTIKNQTSLCLYIVNHRISNFFRQEDVRLADFVSSLAGAAFENAAGFHKISSLTDSLRVDVEERVKAERSLQASLDEKELILREVFHRTKNNMQIISSLLNLQASQVKEEHFKDILRECQGRIMSMSLVHEKLYQSKDLTNIDFSKYIHEISEGLRQSYMSQKVAVEFVIDAPQTFLSLDYAVPCGLIIN